MSKPREKQRSRASARGPGRAGAASSSSSAPAAAAVAPPPGSWPWIRVAPAALGAALVIAGLLDVGPDAAALQGSLIVVGALLAGWNLALLRSPAARARGLTINVELRPQHYMQVLVQATIYAYWGSYLPVPLVSDHVPMLVAQVAFAYGFDLLLSWTRHGRYTLGFGPCPIILSINLFLWFKPDYFYLQFVIVAVGFLAKDLIRWTREGRRVHIFNPSSFPLAIASVVLIATASTGLTWGELIANSQTSPPHMYLLLFCLALPAQILFGVSAISMAAALTTYLLGRLFLGLTGTYFFLDCYIPVSVFIGMLLLVTDPATTPRTELGRLVFGALYGISTVILYQVLTSAGVPQFYDKLLQVPLLNLSVRWLDRLGSWRPLSFVDPARIARGAHPSWRHVGYTTVWATGFAVMAAAGGVGDHHPGQWLPYWMRTCEQGNERACAYLASVDRQICAQGSAWACNESAILGPRSSWGISVAMDAQARSEAFQKACRNGLRPACTNRLELERGNTSFVRVEPSLTDYRYLLRGTRRWSIPDTTPEQIYARACAQGWPGTCQRAGGLVSPP
jgi:hypothetical protein